MDLYSVIENSLIGTTRAGQLIGPVSRFASTLKSGSNNVWEVAEAERSMQASWALMTENVNLLRNSIRAKAVDGTAYLAPGQLPTPFTRYFVIHDQETLRLNHFLEASLNGYLNSVYGLVDRIGELSTWLMKSSDYKIWPIIRTKKGSASEVLLKEFASKTPAADEMVKWIGDLIHLRNLRTHSIHLQATASGPDLEFTFADKNPWQGAASISASETQMRKYAVAFDLFLGWWAPTSVLQIKAPDS